MSYSNGLVRKDSSPTGVANYPTTGDIQQALGDTTGTGDLGSLCTHPNIQKFARYKPTDLIGDAPTDAQIRDYGYGISALAFTDITDLIDTTTYPTLSWTYHGANATSGYRQLDFHRYYNDPKTPFMQANGTKFIVDCIANTPPSILFYMLMRSGALANKPFSTESGIATSGTAVPTTPTPAKLQYCMTIDDIVFDSGGGSPHKILASGTTSYLGIVIFDSNGNLVRVGSGNADGLWSTRAISSSSTRYNEMFIISTSPLISGTNALSWGNYTAVACAKMTDGGLTYYLPVYDDTDYPARFILEVGGKDYYKQQRWGVGTSKAASNDSIVVTNQSTVYVTMRIHNTSGRSIDIAGGSNTKFTLVTEITGRIYVNGQTTPTDINRTRANGKAYVTSTIAIPNSGTITVANNDYGTLVYEVPNIWSVNGTDVPGRIDSGSVTLAASLWYNNQSEFDDYGLSRLLTVTFGS